MRLTSTIFLCAAFTCGTALADDLSEQPWGYRLGAAHPPRQANFCDDQDSALEIAGIFQRFGPRTGFSALAGSSHCATRVHGITPEKLIHKVRIPLGDGGGYQINFIQVRADDGSRPVLITTRKLIEE